MTTATATRRLTGQTLETFMRGSKLSLFDRFLAICQTHGIACDGRAVFHSARQPDMHPRDAETVAQATAEVLPAIREMLAVSPACRLTVLPDVDDQLRVSLIIDPLAEPLTADARLLATVARNCVGGRRLQWHTIADDAKQQQQHRICGVVDGRVVAVVALCTF